MSSPDRVAEILAMVQADDAAAEDVGVASRLVDACRDALPITGAGLSWVTRSGPGALLAATDGAARLVEELQFSLGEGPCIESSRLGRPVLLPNLAQMGPQRWPAFAAGALGAGIAALFAFPLQVGAISLGAMDLYRDTTGLLEEPHLAEALAFASAATVILLDLQAAAPSGGVHPTLAASMIGRAEVHQATGMIAVQMGVDLATALVLLRAHAFSTGRAIVEVAHDVVDRVIRFGP